MEKLAYSDIEKFCGEIDKARNIVIVSHIRPDGDSIASCVAMLTWLAGRGKNAKIVMQEKHPENVGFLISEDVAANVVPLFSDPAAAGKCVADSDLIIVLDMNVISRAGAALCQMIEKPKARRVLIDHHPDPVKGQFSILFSETEVSSTAELLYYILKEISGSAHALLPATARALMTGMTTDTNNFANSVFPTTLEMASDLLSAGVDREAIVENVFKSYGSNRILAMGHLLSKHTRITAEGVAYIILSRRTKNRYSLQTGDTEGFVNIPLTIKNVRISILLTEEKDRFRVSIRSKSGISAKKLAERFFHGGGHVQAAGGDLIKRLEVRNISDVIAVVEDSVSRFFNEDYGVD